MSVIVPPETTYQAYISAALRERPSGLSPAQMVESWIGSAWGDYQETKDPKHVLRIIRYQANSCSGLFSPKEREAIQAEITKNMIKYLDEASEPGGLYYCDSMFELMRVKLPRAYELLDRLDQLEPKRAFSDINLKAFRLVLSISFDNVLDVKESLKLGLESLRAFTDTLWSNDKERYAIRFSQDFPLELRLVGTAYQTAAVFLRDRLDYRDQDIQELFAAIDQEFEMISRIHKRELPETLGNNPPPLSEARQPRAIRIGACEKLFLG